MGSFCACCGGRQFCPLCELVNDDERSGAEMSEDVLRRECWKWDRSVTKMLPSKSR